MAAIQLSFSIRTTPAVKQVHLIGSWDSYQGQLPLSRESSSSKWRGTFRFASHMMQPGSRYWFYYMLDGYQVCHDPSKEFTVEPTTGRNLNILDVPASAASSKSSRSDYKDKRSSRRSNREIPQGRPAAEIRSPKPVRPGQLARQLEKQAATQSTLEQLTTRLAAANLNYDDSDSEIDDDDESGSEADSDVPSLSSGGSSISGCSSPDSVSSASSNCTCERYGVTRTGQRVKLDCGGSRCGDDSQDSSEDEEAREYQHRVRHSHSSHKKSSRSSSDRRRHGVVYK
jgi:hypothetical protein